MRRLRRIEERVVQLRAVYGADSYVMFKLRDIDYLVREINRLREAAANHESNYDSSKR